MRRTMIRRWHAKFNALSRWQQELIGLIYYVQFSPYRPLSKQEQQMLQTLLAKPYTRSIGHYLLDLPTEFEPDEGMFFQLGRSSGPLIESKQQYRGPFNQQMQRYEQELRATKPIDKIDGDYLKRIYPLPNGMIGQVFERMESEEIPDFARLLEAYRWDKEVTFTMKIEAYDSRAVRYDDDRRRDSDVFSYNVPEKLYAINNFFSRLRARAEDDIPTQPGLSVLRGFIAETPGDRLFEPIEQYRLRWGYIHEGLWNLYTQFETSNGSPSDRSLLDKFEIMLTHGQGSTLRKGTRRINGLEAEEWIIKGDLFGKDQFAEQRSGYQFFLTVNEKTSNNTNPSMEISMDYIRPSAEDEAARLTEAELMVIWQQMTASLRLRPGAISPIVHGR